MVKRESHTESQQVRQKRFKRSYLFQNAFVALVAILFLVSSANFWFAPGNLETAVGHVPPYDYYWNGFYLVGAVMVLIGLFSLRVGIEAAGHILFVPGLLLNGIVATAILGFHATTLLVFVFCLGAAFRAYGLIEGWRDAE